MLRIASFSKHDSFFVPITKTVKEFEYCHYHVSDPDAIPLLLEQGKVNLLIIDCQDYRNDELRMFSEAFSEYKSVYLLFLEAVKHELDQDCLLAQIRKQVKLHEVYIYDSFIKQLCFNIWLASKEIFDKFQYEVDKKYNEQLYEQMTNSSQNHKIFTNQEDIDEQKYIDQITSIDPEIIEASNLEPNTKKLLDFFKKNINQAISIDKLSQYMWGVANITKRNAIYVYIRKIRLYLGDSPEDPKILVKVYKSSYKLII